MDKDDTGTLFLDVITLALAGFVCIAILLLPHINPPTKTGNAVTDTQEGVIFEISWDPKMDADVDLWVQAPGDRPVGYSNKGALVCNLLRDDLGQLADPLQINHEQTVCRGLVPNQRYTVNAHAFRGAITTWPIQVNLQVTTKTLLGSAIGNYHTVGVLDHAGEELTLASFELTQEGLMKYETIDTLYKPLRGYSGK